MEILQRLKIFSRWGKPSILWRTILRLIFHKFRTNSVKSWDLQQRKFTITLLLRSLRHWVRKNRSELIKGWWHPARWRILVARGRRCSHWRIIFRCGQWAWTALDEQDLILQIESIQWRDRRLVVNFKMIVTPWFLIILKFRDSVLRITVHGNWTTMIFYLRGVSQM